MTIAISWNAPFHVDGERPSEFPESVLVMDSSLQLEGECHPLVLCMCCCDHRCNLRGREVKRLLLELLGDVRSAPGPSEGPLEKPQKRGRERGQNLALRWALTVGRAAVTLVSNQELFVRSKAERERQLWSFHFNISHCHIISQTGLANKFRWRMKIPALEGAKFSINNLWEWRWQGLLKTLRLN